MNNVRRILIGLIVLAMSAPGLAADANKQQNLVDQARITLDSFLADPNMPWFRDHVKDAHGLLIVPQMLKAAFFFGGSGGSGVLLVRDEKTGDWSQPAFYTVGSASFGLQFGGQASELVLMVTTRKGIEPLYTTTLKLGIDASVAVGPVGTRVEGATPLNLSADYLSFARSKGAFVGFSLEGAVVASREKWNNAYYGQEVRPVQILVEGEVTNPQSAGLRATAARATKAP
ncbi:MAG: lipid-binding SYLF domain-containing protein [Deltaproteobacteria bacterium]|nr:MAG: lipid-binding SYLF domain-containing protein [Deltaproteobacteria bacterium]